MAKREKDRMYYEITRERPFGDFQTLLVGGSAGAVVAFSIASLVGACSGMAVDTIVLVFLIASLLGFFFGGILTFLAVRYFGKWVSDASMGGVKAAEEPMEEVAPPGLEGEVETPGEAGAAAQGDEDKGKSVDFVFPELSPDKQ